MREIKFISSQDFVDAMAVIQMLIDQSELLCYTQDDVVALMKTKAIITSEYASMVHQEAGAEVTLESE